MLTIEIPSARAWNEQTERFVTIPAMTLVLTHSLVTLSKWESKHKKPFLSSDKKTEEETFSYIQIMAGGEVSIDALMMLTPENFKAINELIEDKQTATWFREVPGARRPREVLTSELIYQAIWALQMPMDVETWHLNRLFTAIRVVSEKNNPNKKKNMSRADAMAQQRQLNAQRKAQMGTTG